MAKILSGTGGTVPELLKKFRSGKGLDSGTISWYASLATRPKVPMAMLRWFWGVNDKNKKNPSSDKSSSKKPAVAGWLNNLLKLRIQALDVTANQRPNAIHFPTAS